MVLFFVEGRPDSDRYIKYCYSHYADIIRSSGGEAPKDIEIIREKGRKPRADKDGVYFSLSHSGNVTMLAMSHTEIGADVEKIREIDFKAFDFIKSDGLEDFFAKWTEREAYLKMTGEGLCRFRREIPADAHFEHFDVFDGYHACVCAEEQSIVAYQIDAAQIGI